MFILKRNREIYKPEDIMPNLNEDEHNKVGINNIEIIREIYTFSTITIKGRK